MLLTLYPNGELRARVHATPLTKLRPVFSAPSKAESLILSIDKKFSSISGSGRTSDPDLPPVRVGFGGSPSPTPFSLYGRRKLVRSGALLGEGEARSRVLFLTGTLPGSTDEAFRALSDYSAWCVNELLTHIPRLWGGKQSDCRYIWVWELQKRGALHWHCVLECPSAESASFVRDGFKGLWIRIVKSIGRMAGIDMAERAAGGSWADLPEVWRVEAAPARKNPSRYLAKYLSKPNGASGSGSFYFPTRWYGISRTLHSALAENTFSVNPSRITDERGRVSFTNLDVSFVEKMFGLSYSSAQFSDKVRDGFTFVFYVSEDVKSEVFSLMKDYLKESDSFARSLFGGKVKEYPFLMKIRNYVGILEMFLNDIGPASRALFDSWSQGEYVPGVDLDILENYAHESLIRAGLIERVIPPKRSGAGLTGQGVAKMEVSGGGCDDFDQPSLFA